MKRIYCLLILCLAIGAFAQQQRKPVLTPTDLGTFPEIKSPEISSDGLFVSYIISGPKQKTGIIKATKSDWKLELANVSKIEFTTDGKSAVLTLGHDSVILVKNGTSDLRYLTGVKQCKLFEHNKKSMLAYLQQNKLNLLEFGKGSRVISSGVIDYLIAPNGNSCLVKSIDHLKIKKERISWLDIGRPYEVVIWQGEKAMSWIFDNAGEQAAFFAIDTVKSRGKANALVEIYYYRKGGSNAEILLDGNSSAIEEGLELKPYENFKFSKNDKVLFFTATSPSEHENVYNANLIVWNYLDPNLPVKQPSVLNQATENYLFSVKIINKNIFRLTKKYERVELQGIYDTRLLICKAIAHPYELTWNKASLRDYIIVSAESGERKLIKKESKDLLKGAVWFSANNKLFYYDNEYKDGFCYSWDSGKLVNLTNGFFNGREISFAGLIAKEKAMLTTKSDVFVADLNGLQVPYNMIKVDNQIISKKIEFNRVDIEINKKGEISQNTLILQGRSENGEKNGFLSLNLNKRSLDILSMEPVYIDHSIKKAKLANTYLLIKERPDNYPNLFITNDFKTYSKISDLHPEKQYNWMQTEMHQWIYKQDTLTGLLYKPENFDKGKKYPLIFYYYPEEVLEANEFMPPKIIGGAINIPYFVSNGYLVFQPFIKTIMGAPGESALEPVISASDYLRQFLWIDSTRMGLHGHSMGGFETNYIVTHSNRFAAAISCAGISNLISRYNSIWGDGQVAQRHTERGQFQIGSSLWENLNAYLQNSPILKADCVTTPLLLVHNGNDTNVANTQSLELFLALRRLQKPSWLLQYTKEGHLVMNAANYRDMQLRMKSFFDHFLMNQKAPDWMVGGSNSVSSKSLFQTAN